MLHAIYTRLGSEFMHKMVINYKNQQDAIIKTRPITKRDLGGYLVIVNIKQTCCSL